MTTNTANTASHIHPQTPTPTPHSANIALPKKGGRPFRSILFISLGSIATVLVAIYMTGFVEGEEFCPQTFARRSYWFYRIPVINIQFVPTFRDPKNYDLQSHLSANALIRTSATNPKRWDPVYHKYYSMAQPSTPHDAAILCSYLDQYHDNAESKWLAWSKKNPNHAKAFWPLVAQTAQDGRYEFVPDLFRQAELASDDGSQPAIDALTNNLHQILARQYCDRARALNEMGDSKHAKADYQKAIDFVPDFPAAVDGMKTLSDH